MKNVIEDYRKIVFESYKKCFEVSRKLCKKEEVAEEDLTKLFMEFCGKVSEWEGKYLKPYWLDEDSTDGFISRSWKYEYAIFNLVYIYRSFDFENDFLIFSGW